MNAFELSSVPTPLPDDAPGPRTTWRRWGLALLVSLPVAAAYGAVVMVLGRTLFLDAAEASALAERTDGMSPTMVLWLVGAASSLPGVAYVAHEALTFRAMRRGKTTQGGVCQWARTDGRSWAVPVLLSGSPVAAIVLAAAVAGLSSLLASPGEAGRDALLFASVAGGWLMLLVVIGWVVLLAPRDTRSQRHHEEGVEHAWVQQAAHRAFWDVMLIAGVAAFVNAITGDRLSASTALIGVLLLAQGDFAARTWLLRRRDERA